MSWRRAPGLILITVALKLVAAYDLAVCEDHHSCDPKRCRARRVSEPRAGGEVVPEAGVRVGHRRFLSEGAQVPGHQFP